MPLPPFGADPPYDRALALASFVRTMWNHFLAVRCGCGAKRVIVLARMADDSRLAYYTLAHVVMTLRCDGCHDGSDQVYLTATIHGMDKPVDAASLSWVIPLVDRVGAGAKRLRQP